MGFPFLILNGWIMGGPMQRSDPKIINRKIKLKKKIPTKNAHIF
jgi:hypothetical protein